MKKQLLFIVLMVVTISQMYAQGQNRIGGHLSYGTKDLNLGFGAQGEFSLSDNISIAPKFTYFTGTSTDIGNGLKIEAGGYTIDGDLHYYFTTEKTSFYGLAGLTYSGVKVSVAGQSATDGKIGLNVGAGVNFNTGSSFIPNLEIKYNTPFSALMISAGVSFPLGGK